MGRLEIRGRRRASSTLVARHADQCYGGRMTGEKPQLDKFKEAARELECDDDEKRFKQRLGKLAKARPAPDKK